MNFFALSHCFLSLFFLNCQPKAKVSKGEDVSTLTTHHTEAESKTAPPDAYDVSRNAIKENMDEMVFLTNYGVVPNSKKDQTSQIQHAFKAISGTGKKLIINKGVYWISGISDTDNERYLYDKGGIKVYSNSVIEFEEGAIFRVLPNSYNAYNCLRLWNVRNIKISGGKLIGERDKHRGSSGEWGYGIFIGGAQDIQISNMDISNFWGDGINLNAATLGDEILINRNIIISDIVCRQNRRQGMSIETGKDIQILRSKFIDNFGKIPQSGIDIEPWSENYSNVERILIQECVFRDNPQGVMINFPNLRDIKLVRNKFEASDPDKVNYHIWQLNGASEALVSDCSFDNKATNMLITSGKKMTIINCQFSNNVKMHSERDTHVDIKNCTFRGGEIITEKTDKSILIIRHNKFLSNSKMNFFGGSDINIEGNIMKASKDIFISDQTNAHVVIKNNTFNKSANQAITTDGNISIIGNVVSASETFVAIRENAKNILVSQNMIDTKLKQAFNFFNMKSVSSFETNSNRFINGTVLLKDFQESIKDVSSNVFN